MTDRSTLLNRASTLRRQLQRQFDQRTPRERLMLIVAGLAAALALGDFLWISPGLSALQAARQRAKAAQTARQGGLADLQRLQAVSVARDQQLKTELDTWRQRVRQGDAALQRHEETLVGPDRMVELLDHVLARHGSLRLRDMRSLGRSDLLAATAATGPNGQPLTPAAAAAAATAMAAFAGASAPMPATPSAPMPVNATAATAATAPATGPGSALTQASLYRHGVEITLEGSFGELLSYLRTLEAMPQHVLWGGLQMKTAQHPTTVMTLRLYTISRDRTWLEI